MGVGGAFLFIGISKKVKIPRRYTLKAILARLLRYGEN